MSVAFVAFGGNIGNVFDTFRGARDDLAVLPGCRIEKCSLLYTSAPIGPEEQPDYLNAMVSLYTELMPRTLLHEMQRTEERFGRTRHVRWGPRTLDLDLVAVDNKVEDTVELKLPHPEMHKRIFVLEPLCDLAPEWQHPLMKQTACELLEACIRAGYRPLKNGIPW